MVAAIVAVSAVSGAMISSNSSTASEFTIHDTVRYMEKRAERASDQIEDMKIVQEAIHNDPQLRVPGRYAVNALVKIANDLYLDTPHIDLQTSDESFHNVKKFLFAFDSVSETGRSIMVQRQVVTQATIALGRVVDAYRNGMNLDMEIARFDKIINDYKAIEPVVAEKIQQNITDLKDAVAAEPSKFAL